MANRELGVFNIDGRGARDPQSLPTPARPTLRRLGLGHDRRWTAHRRQLAWIWEGEVVTCPWHSLEFHVPTGRCVAFEEIRLRTYDVRVSDTGEIAVVI